MSILTIIQFSAHILGKIHINDFNNKKLINYFLFINYYCNYQIFQVICHFEITCILFFMQKVDFRCLLHLLHLPNRYVYLRHWNNLFGHIKKTE